MHWDDARIFLAIARTGSLSGAASALGMGVATVSRRLERLEAALGLPLFSHHQSGYHLTEDGEAMLSPAEALEDAGLTLQAVAQQQNEIAGSVRLATAENLATPLIVPSLPALLNSYPALRVEIVSGVQTVNLHRRDADLAVRMVQPEAGNVTIKRLGTLGFGLYAASSYIHRRKGGTSITNFDSDDFVAWPHSHHHLPAAQWIQRSLRGRAALMTANSLSTQIAAVASGIGLGVVPHFLARKAGLVCMDGQIGADQPIWLAMHSDLSHARRVRVVADHLVDLFESQRNELAHP